MTMNASPHRDTAVWNTWKGHGRPARVWFFGQGGAPDLTGSLVTISTSGRVLEITWGGRTVRVGTATKFWAAPVVEAAPADVALVEAVHPGLLARLAAAQDEAAPLGRVSPADQAANEAYAAALAKVFPADDPAPAADVASSVEALTAGTADAVAGMLFDQVDRALSADDELILTSAFLAALDVVRDRLNDRREAAVQAAHAQGATYAELGALVGLSATRIARLATGTGRYVPRREEGAPAFTVRPR